jgi:tetratricopeptide (TPR) repeat protein
VRQHVLLELSRFLRDLRAQDDDATLEQLASIGVGEWTAFLDAHPAMHTIFAFESILDRAHEELDRDPSTACQLTVWVVQHIDTIRPPASGVEMLLPIVIGRAWKEHANALRAMGQTQEARVALETAITVLAKEPAAALELEAARLLDAYMRHESGDSERALHILRTSVDNLAAVGDARGHLRARMLQATILFERGNTREALMTFEAALGAAHLLGDEREGARITANLGHCYVRTGNYRRAQQYFEDAAPRYARLGMDAEAQRVTWGLAEIATHRSHLPEALERMEAVRQGLAERGMVTQAAVAGLEVAVLLLLLERYKDARELCTELIATFTAAGMLEKASLAREYLAAAGDSE